MIHFFFWKKEKVEMGGKIVYKKKMERVNKNKIYKWKTKLIISFHIHVGAQHAAGLSSSWMRMHLFFDILSTDRNVWRYDINHLHLID